MLRRVARGIFLIICFCLMCSSTLASTLSIEDAYFDFSDSIILIKTKGSITPIMSELTFKSLVLEGGKVKEPNSTGTPVRSPIRKGVLSNPDRVFFDIDNAVLTGESKSWKFQNSNISEIKISQYSVKPEVVRITLSIKNSAVIKNIKISNEMNQLFIKYGNATVSSLDYKDIYKNHIGTPLSYNTVAIKDGESNKYEDVLTHTYFLNEVKNFPSGVFLKGVGHISIKGVSVLENPKRMVIDIENAKVNSTLRSKNIILGDINLKNSADGQNIPQRSVLKIGQFNSNTVRLVIQGESATNYRFVTAPNLSDGYIAKNQDILKTKMYDLNSKILNITITKPMQDISLVKIVFDSPIAYSIFESGGYLHFDVQNSVCEAYSEFSKIFESDPEFKNSRIVKIASDKTRISIPSKNKIITSRISSDAKSLQIYVKNPVQVVKKIPAGLKEKIQPSIIQGSYKVLIDPGHGGSDTGAIREGVNEKVINQAISNLVIENLKKNKINVITTMPFDKTVTLQERVEYSENEKPDVYVSIHSNASMKPEINGIEIHWYKNESYKLAETVHGKFATSKNLKKWETADRGLFKSQFYVINHTTMPAILIELGFMSNPKELKNLQDPKIQSEMAEAISAGIVEYLKKRGK